MNFVVEKIFVVSAGREITYRENHVYTSRARRQQGRALFLFFFFFFLLLTTVAKGTQKGNAYVYL